MTQDTPSIAASEGDWIEWNGGECPVDPETPVQVLLGGETPAKFDPEIEKAKNWDFTWAGAMPEDYDIIAYRIVRTALQEHSE